MLLWVNIDGQAYIADTGFGGLENVARTVYEFEKLGLAGCHIEDQEFPKRCGHLAGKSIVDLDEMVAKIKAAVAARHHSAARLEEAPRRASRRQGAPRRLPSRS